MRNANLSVKFWGTRGAYPFFSGSHQYLGGDTSAVEVNLGQDRLLIDGGSGLGHVSISPNNEVLLLSHFHLDHIIGLPLFLTKKLAGDVKIVSGINGLGGSIKKSLSTVFGNVAFPVPLEMIHDRLSYHRVKKDTVFEFGPWIIETNLLNHPGGASGFKIRHRMSNSSVIYLADHEHGSLKDDSLVKFAKESDLVIWDGCYDESQMQKVRGFGHSSWQDGLKFQADSGCKKLAITGHGVERDDSEAHRIENLLDPTKTFLARDKLLLDLDEEF